MKKNREVGRGREKLQDYMEAVQPTVDKRLKDLTGFPTRVSLLRKKVDDKSRLPEDMRIKEVANFLGISATNAGRYERVDGNGQFPNYPNLVRIATLFGVTLDYLILGEDSGVEIDEDSDNVTIQMLKNKIAEKDKVIEAQETLLSHYRGK